MISATAGLIDKEKPLHALCNENVQPKEVLPTDSAYKVANNLFWQF